MLKKKMLCMLTAVFAVCVLFTGCDDADETAESSESAAAAETEQEEESVQTEDAKVPAASLNLQAYAMQGQPYAVQIPAEFSHESQYDSQSNMMFTIDGTNDDITLFIQESWTEEEFASLTKEEFFGLINYSITLPEVTAFEPVELPHADGVNVAGYYGECVGTIDQETAYQTMLVVNCPESDQAVVLAIRDEGGEWEAYRSQLQEYLYLNETGYEVDENGTLQAAEPLVITPQTFSNDSANCAVELTTEWTEMEEIVSGDGNTPSEDEQIWGYEAIDGSSLLLTTAAGVTDAEFLEAAENDIPLGEAGGRELLTSAQCTVGGYTAYRYDYYQSVGGTEADIVALLINRTGEQSDILMAVLTTPSGEHEELAEHLEDYLTVS